MYLNRLCEHGKGHCIIHVCRVRVRTSNTTSFIHLKDKFLVTRLLDQKIKALLSSSTSTQE